MLYETVALPIQITDIIIHYKKNKKANDVYFQLLLKDQTQMFTK